MSKKQKCYLWIGTIVIATSKKEAAEILNRTQRIPPPFRGNIKAGELYEIPWENAYQAINKDEHNV